MSMSVLTPNGGLELFPIETHSCSYIFYVCESNFLKVAHRLIQFMPKTDAQYQFWTIDYVWHFRSLKP